MILEDVIKEFLEQYASKQETYLQIKEYVQNIIETALKDAGIMAITSSRVKDKKRLAEKLTQRNEKKKYQSVKAIEEDIPDFIGLRIALYFPSDKDRVEALIERLFDIKKIKCFPDAQRQNAIYTRRFSGYCATHYRVYLKESSHPEWKSFLIEIQVASLLMHAWSEVEHDLAYKQKKGNVSYEEYETLDEINGLVLAGELSLQRLQRISEFRLSSESKEFQNHYQLAAFLCDKAKEAQNSTPYLGDVETLFEFFKSKDRLTTKKIENDMLKINWNDNIPIAQQLIDLYADKSVKALELVFLNKYNKSWEDKETYFFSADNNILIKNFFKKWIALEKTFSEKLILEGYDVKKSDIGSPSVSTDVFLPNVVDKYNALKEVRNKIVHNGEIIEKERLQEYMKEITEISKLIKDPNDNV